MVIENVNIYELIPTQIVDMIHKLNHALKIVKSRKQTISKTASFEKYLNFSFSESHQNEILLKEAFSNSTNLNSTQMYNNFSNMDFNTVYADYDFVPSRTI